VGTRANNDCFSDFGSNDSEVQKLRTSYVSKLLLAVAIIVLVISALANSRDYQDSWVLEGLEIPFALFVIIYVIAFFSEKKTSWMIILAITGRIVFLILPSLKYVWFQGTAIDQQLQYALANHVVSEGHVSTAIAYGAEAYTSAPLMHISFSIFSIILNVPVTDSLKYLPILWSPIIPLLTFVIVKRMGFSKGNSILKYALFFSSIPFTAEQYLVTGTLLGGLYFLLVLSSLVLILKKNDGASEPKDDRIYWVFCAIFAIALAATHSVSSIMLSVALVAILLLQRVPYFRPKSHLQVAGVLAIVLIGLAWLLFQSSYALEQTVRSIFIGVPSGATPGSERIPASFFEHILRNPLSAIRSFSVLYGADAFLLLLALVSLVIMLKMKKRSNDVQGFIQLLGLWFFFLIVIGALLNLGGPRALNYERLLFPIFSGILVFWVSINSRIRKWMPAVIFVSIILLATIELYSCQPLVPPANVIYPGLPSDIPIGYVGQVTSIYQRQAIFFAENHVNGLVACDSTTSNQIIGLTGLSWSKEHLVLYNPLGKSQQGQEYDYFLIHLPGKSGILSELPPARVPTLVLNTIYNSSIVYTNGESYMLSGRLR
jgi:hypothetical protein